jgi:hypothetical protein
MSGQCEACERADATVIDSCDDPQEPYRLCSDCHHRLHQRSLRPLEWYNLAKRHGCFQFLLHEDFYLEDGTADQPEEDVERPEEYPIPTLASVCNDPEFLLDYTITRWRLHPDTKAAWNRIPRPVALATLFSRFVHTSNCGIRGKVLEVCAAVVRAAGADFVRFAWGEYPNGADLLSLAQASAACLPKEEAYKRVKSALTQLEGRNKRDLMFCLGYFHTQDALDWIEQSIFEPITEAWGHLAAASNIDWRRAEDWLARGRPLSLVAIDTLLTIARARPLNLVAPQLKARAPSLTEPPTQARFREVLAAYRQRDPVPRVQKRIETLLTYIDKLTTNE